MAASWPRQRDNAAVSDLEAAVDRLHAVPLEEFVDERKRLAKELRTAGDRTAAAELAKLPKPSAPAWALNHVARDQPQDVEPWLDAAAALREASMRADRASGDELRAAMAAHRDATRRLLATVRDTARPNGRALSEPMLDRVRELLQAATADPERAELLRAGRVVETDDQPKGSAPTARRGAEPATKRGAKPDRGGEPATKPGAKPDRDGEPATKPGAEPDRDGEPATKRGTATAGDEARARREAEARAQQERDARAELERLVAEAEAHAAERRDAAAEAAAAAAAADERLEEARRTLHRSESEAAAAHEAADEAADAAEQAERELRTLSAKLSA